MTPNQNFDEIKKQAQSEGKVLADFEARDAIIAQNYPDKRTAFAFNSAAQNWSRQSFIEHKTDLSRINYDSLNDEQKRLYDTLDALNRESERIAYEDKKNQTIRGVSALIQKGEELSDAEVDAGIMAWANLTGLYKNMPVEQIAEAWNVSDKRKLWLEVLRPAFISLSSSPKTRLELLAMGEEKRREEFDKYWKSTHLPDPKEQAGYALSSAFDPYMSGFSGTTQDQTPSKPPKIPEPTEQDYQDWIAEKTFGLQRLQLEYLLQSNMSSDVAALAWKVALSNMLSTEEKAKIIESSDLSPKEQSQVLNAAYAMNSELDYGLLWQSYFKSKDALSDFTSNVWDFSADTLPKLALDLLSELGITEQSPLDLYEKIEEAGGLEDFFEKNEIRSGAKMINIEKIYELGKTQAEARKLRRQLENADANRYKSLGFVNDGISDGVAVFARMTPVFATRLIPGVGGAVSEYLLIADMTQALSEDMQDVGFTEKEARWYGLLGGAMMARIEHMQIRGIEKIDNAFLTFIRSFAGKRAATQLFKKSARKALAKRAKISFEEFVEETVQNFIGEGTIQLAQHFEGKELKSMQESLRDFAESLKQSLIPIVVATNIGGGIRGSFDFTRDLASLSRASKNGEIGMLQLRSKAFKKMLEAARAEVGFESSDWSEYVNPSTSKNRRDEIIKKYGSRGESVRRIFDELKGEWDTELEGLLNAATNAISENSEALSQEELEKMKASGEFRSRAESLIKAYVDAYGGAENVVFVQNLNELPEDVKAKIESRTQGGAYIVEGFNVGDKTYIVGDALSSPNRTLSILKHERTHWGMNSARSSKKTKKFLDAILDIYGGEDVVRAALSARAGDFYKDTDKYELAEEFLCRIAEKVAGKYELNEKEKSAFAKAKEFLIDLFSYIPKDASDEFIAHQIRLIWDKNYAVGEDGDFFADLNDDIRLSVKKSDAERFSREIDDFVNGNLDNRHVFKLGRTPEVMRLVGAEDLPLELTASVLQKKEIKHSLNLESLKNLPVELADPIAIFNSASVPDALLVVTEILGANGNKIAVAVHLNKMRGRNTINDIRSIHERSDFNLQTLSDIGTLRYINTKRKPRSLRPNRMQNSVGGSANKAYGSSVFTEADLSQEEKDNIFSLRQNNPRFRYSVRANPSPEEIAEAKRQKEEVKAKWTNPDGSMKKGYMLAPNGKPTKLSEEQWLMVRTPNFKRWFGDWETLAEYEFLNGKSIRDISTKSVPSGGFAAIREWAAKIFERQGGVARNSILGDVILDKASVRDSLAHGGANLYKSAAFEVAKDVIEKGYLIFNDVNKGRDSYYFAAPINIDGVPNIVVALVHKRENGNHFYLHSVGTKESLLGNRVSGMSKVKPSAPSTTYPRDYLQALQNIFNVKPEKVSKVVDENGEPLVVYHGATAIFNEFKSKFIGYSTGTADGRGFYFTSDKSYAYGFKSKDGRVIEAFLNIRSTLDYEKKTIGKAELKNIIKEIDKAEFETEGEHYFISNFGNYYYEGIDKVIDEATKSNYDFCDTDVDILNVLVSSGADFDLTAKVIKDATGKDGEIVPKDNNTTHFIIFNSNQAKSATDNVGTFSDSPDIRFSVRANPQKNKKTLALILAPDILKSDGKITDEIRRKATLYAQSLSENDLQDAIADAGQIALALSQSIDKKAASIPNGKLASTASEYFRSKTIESLRKDIFKAMSLSEKSQRLKSKFDAEKKRQKAAQDAAERARKAAADNLAAADRGYSPDQLLAHDIDIAGAIFDFAQNADSETIAKNIADADFFVKERKNGPAYAPALAQTLLKALMQAARELPYSKSRESAINAINALAKLKTPEAILERANTIAKRLAEYYKEHLAKLSLAEFERMQAEIKAAQKEAKTKEKIDSLKKRIALIKLKYRRKNLLRELDGRLSKFSAKSDKKHRLERSLPALASDFLAYGKKYMDFYPEKTEGVKKSSDNVADEFKRLSEQTFQNTADAVENRLRLRALSIFGALNYESDIARIASALDFAKSFIADEKSKALADIAEFEQSSKISAQALAEGLARRSENLAGSNAPLWKELISDASVLKHALESVFVRFARGKIAQNAQSQIDSIVSQISRAAIKERNLNLKGQKDLQDALRDCYGSANRATSELLTPRENYRKYSAYGAALCKAQLLAQIAMLEQETMQIARHRLEQIQENQDEDAPKLNRDSQNLLERFDKLEDMKNQLSDADFLLLEKIKDIFAERFEDISAAVENFTGRPLKSSDQSYFPIFRKLTESTAETGGFALRPRVPGYVLDRTISLRDIDEGFDILSIFRDRTAEDSHFLAFADLGFKIDAIFADETLAQIMREKLPENERRELLAFLGQSARGYAPAKSSPNSRFIQALNAACATFGIGWNPASALKQASGLFAFGLETGIAQNLKDIAWAILTTKGRQSFAEVFKSQLMRDRREAGLNPAIALAISQFQNGSFGTGFSALRRFVAALKPFALIGYADSFVAALGGAGIYARIYSNYRLEHSHQDAERLAGLDFAEIVERTQQSNFIHNKSGSVRNETALGRTLMLFRSAPQQMLSFEIKALKDYLADKTNGAKFQRLCEIMLINHILVPAAFNGLGVLISLALGDDWDNDDWSILAASTFLDVLGGIAVGALLKGAIAIGAGAANRDLSSDVIPAAGLARIGNQIGLMIGDIRQGEFSENLTKRLKNIAKQINAPARYAFKLYDNATDNKKGAWW